MKLKHQISFFNFTHLLLLILSLNICSGCWNKQAHEIAAPKIPVYSFSGNISELYTGTPLPGIRIECIVHETAFDLPTEEPVVFTDSSGYFQFQLTPGDYILVFNRGSLQLMRTNLSMPFAPREQDYELPAVLTTDRRYQQPRILGITELSNQELAIIQEWEPDSAVIIPRILRGDFDFGFVFTGVDKFARRNPEFSCLTYFGNRYWATGGTLANPVLYQIHPDSGKVILIEPMPHRIADLTSDENYIWATATNDSIYQFQMTVPVTIRSFFPGISYLSGISFSGENFWLFSQKTNYLYQSTLDLVPIKAYRLFFLEAGLSPIPIDDIEFLAISAGTRMFLIRWGTVYQFAFPH